MNRKKYSNIMLRIEMAIASSMLGSFIFEQTLFLTFIHYVSHFTDLLKIKSVDAMRKMFEFKREFDEFKSGKKLLNYDTIFNFLKTIELEYQLKNGHLSYAIDFYEKFIKTIKKTDLKVIFEALSELNDENEIKDFIRFGFEVYAPMDGKMATSSIYSPSIKKLGLKLLDITNEDLFMDCNAGKGSLLCELNPNNKYIGYEANPNNICFLNMVGIIFNFENININDNFFFFAEEEKANKIYVDNLINIRLDDPRHNLEFKYGSNDSNLILFKKVYKCLEENGRAVLALPSRVLFSESSRYHEVRRFISENCLSAVISLPPLWNFTAIDTNIIVLEKNRKNNDVMFIDAKTASKKVRGRNILLDDEIDKIVDIYNKKLAVPGFSMCVHKLDTVCRGTWLPSAYIQVEENNTKRDFNKIEEELNDLYSKLFDNRSL